MYNVSITSVSTAVYSGKTKTRYTKSGFFTGRRPAFKKAIVTVKEGQMIDFFANI
jgi:large subunit ribosomal protein L23